MTKEDILKEKYRKMSVKAEYERSFPDALKAEVVEKIIEKEIEKIVEVPVEVIKEVEIIKEVDNPKHLEAIEILKEENKSLKSKISKSDNEIKKLKKALVELTTQ